MFVGGQPLSPRLRYHARQKLPGYICLQQAVAVLGEGGRVPDFVVRIQLRTSGTAGCNPSLPSAIVRCGSNTASAATALATASPAQSTDARRERTSYRAAARASEYLVHHSPDRAQRMILAHAHLGRQVTEHMILLLIVSAHAFSYHTRLWINSGFLAACQAVGFAYPVTSVMYFFACALLP